MAGYKTYETFDDFAADKPANKQEIIRDLRMFVVRCAPELVESSKWGRGCWLNGELPVAFVHVEPDYVQLGFYGGSFLDDPAKLLHGNAKYIRHVKIYTSADIDEYLLTPLVRQAVALNYKSTE